MIVIDKRNIKINMKIIETFEKEIGSKLPQEYCEFLLEYNGGIPERNIYENQDVSISVQTFYGLGLNSIDDIRHKIDVLQYRIPRECVPIAEIEGGDVLCIALSQKKYGEILLWQHEEELNEGYTDNISMLKKVALTFNDFLKGLLCFEVNDEDSFKVNEIWIDPEFLKELGKG
jgi:hypothetical protein